MQIASNIQISIIVPAYNSAHFLERCINSMSCQDLPYDCYEVIVINDGSTDNTVEVLDKLCTKYSFLRYITTQNGGVSQARNKGIEEAVGKYLLFIDSDDSISPSVLGQIYNEMVSGELDMMLMNYVHVAADGEYMEIPFDLEKNPRRIVSGQEFLLKDAFLPMVCMYVYRRLFLVENALRMVPIRHEDEEFVPRAIYWARRIKYFPLLYYVYFQNEGSYMENYKESNYIYFIRAMVSLIKFKDSIAMNVGCRKYLENRVARTLMQIFKNSIRGGGQNQKMMIEEVVKANILPLHPQKSSFYFFLFNISPALFEKYYRFIKSKPKRL